MRSLLALLLVLNLLTRPTAAQIAPPPTAPASASPTSAPPTNASPPADATDRLTQSNRELLDLLKKQQGVLEDIQYDRRLQSRQIQSLEERLEESLKQNADLQAKIAKLQALAAATPTPASATGINATVTPAPPTAQAPTPPPHVGSYLPPEEPLEPEAQSWHRLFILSGDDVRKTDLFHIQGHRWRIHWHNQDKPGAAYANTSALFISAFPKNDTIPQKVCAKLGSGGDTTELEGAGNYYLKIEASGGSWELAVEDFR